MPQPYRNGELAIVIDCSDLERSAQFWASVLGFTAGRILGLGATLLTGQAAVEDGWRWHILADPDGNEFCVLQPPDADGIPAPPG